MNKGAALFTPLLSTKLYLPRRQPLVSRPRLIRRLEAGLGRKLTLIAAPAGSGKSTLLSEWIGDPRAIFSQRRPTFCWLALDESDNDLIRFWLYFIAALQSANPNLSEATPTLLQSPEAPPIETILTLLLNDLDAWLTTVESQPGPALVLVLEDYHVIATPAIHESITFLLDHLSPALHLVISTRADPPLPLARLRARNQLAEIRMDDLRFTTEETALFLNDRMALGLGPAEIHLLVTRTEGWIVGIQLAALSMQGHVDQADFLRSFSGSHRYILSYLIEEVLNQQSQSVEKFLLYTSILNRLCGPLCNAVLGTEQASAAAWHSQSILEQLEQANLFLAPLDDRGQWYRYHQLFAEVLQHRLRQRQPAMVALLQQRASLWYEQEGYIADAIHHALLGTDFPRAARLIEQVWSTLWNQGAIATLFAWVQALPAGMVLVYPSLYVSYAWGLALTGQIEAAEAVLGQVEATLQALIAEAAATTTPQILLGRAAALRAMLAARRGEPMAAVQLAHHALTLLPAAAQQGEAYYALGLAQQQQGALAAAYQAYERAAQFGVARNDSFLSVAARYHEARILMVQGHLQQAASAYQQILTLVAQTKKMLPVVGLAHIGYGEILYQWNDLTAAAHQVDMGLALSPNRDLTYTDGPLHRFSILARIRQALGDRQGALAAVKAANETAQQTGIALDLERAAALEVLIQLRWEEVTLAEPWASHYSQRHPPAAHVTYLHEFETLTWARVLLAQGRGAELLTLLAQWVATFAAHDRQGTVLEIQILQVLALRLAGQSQQAMHLLTQTLVAAEPEGYIRLFVDEGEVMQQAIVACQAHHPEWPVAQQHYVAQLLSAFPTAGKPLAGQALPSGGAAPAPLLASRTLPPPVLIEPLTERELEILRLVADGLSNAAIAAQLMIAVGTVKTHLKRIYGKFAVQSRTQAIAEARMLDLL